MSKPTYEEMMEFRNDIMQERKQERDHECQMRQDIEFVCEQFDDQINDAIAELQGVCDKLSRYGHELTVKELMEMY